MGFYDDSGFSPDCSIGYLVRRTHQLGSAQLESIFANEGLTAMQWQALAAIWYGRGNTAAELARDLGHDKGAMTRLVDAMELQGWITRERTAGDRRCVNLALTSTGEAVALRCKQEVLARWNDWLADWDPPEVATMIGLLQKLRDTLAKKAA
ncbi:MarR family transcriptional regulator [Sphingomonas sp. Leaf339]|uniref:MarR family winged helix-turn-helix transcriptional regulator n=1 Tax=Sphingomonas sp. Leaf339 TaxID=1736343 RepID=UPI0006FB1570|nr:MarR family winged helix-turn-helix transcriptional regulator [Sphingomonas sp. Leaf339]KQU56153.1 MarR family transcriptional regulator [Sphingomonas sp. Leaf339]